MRGNSFRMRAYFAATSTPRYLFAVRSATSFGVNTCIGRAPCRLLVDFLLQTLDDRAQVLFQIREPRPPHRLGIDDARDLRDGRRPVRRSPPRTRTPRTACSSASAHLSRRFSCAALSVPRSFSRSSSTSPDGGSTKISHRLREGAAELRRPLHVDVHDHVPSRRQHPLHLRPQRSVPRCRAPPRSRRTRRASAPRRELRFREEVIVPPVHLARPRRARRAAHRVADILASRQQRPRDRRLARRPRGRRG